MSDFQDVFGSAFDADSVEPQGDFEVIPPGRYTVIIDKAEVKGTKKGNGHLLEIEMSILGDEKYKNRKLWDRINIDNPSQQCVEIGLRTLGALCKAGNIAKLEDEAQLVNTTVVAHVKVRSGGDYGEQNEIRTYSSVADQQAAGRVERPPALLQPQSQAPAQAINPVAPPWERGNPRSPQGIPY